jgi:hypothetical protein
MTVEEDFYCLDVDQSAQSFLNLKSEEWQIGLGNEQFAKMMDDHDNLRSMRQEFHYPKMETLPHGLY